jgi:hypothetical protein
MAFNVATLTAYVDEQRVPLIGKAVLSSKTAKLLSLQTGVKGKAALNLLTTTTSFGDGNTCGFSDAGSAAITQRVLTVGAIKVNKSYCDRTLMKYWMGYDVKVAAGQKTLPFEEQLVMEEIKAVGAALETAIWYGDTGSGNANLNKFDGLIKLIDAEASVIDAANAGQATLTESNAIAVIDNVYRAIPAALLSKDDVVIVCGSDTFRKYTVALKNANQFHWTSDATSASNQEMVVPGTNVKLIALDGLNATDATARVFAFSLSNVFYGTDLEGDEEKFEIWYSKDNQEFRLVINFNAGVQFAFPDEIVQWTHV